MPVSETVADVGTDHGYLAVWLLQSGKAKRVLASDIHAGPLNRARQTAAEYEIETQITLHLSDGLQFPGSDLADTVAIAGMGGETMISILSAAPWTKQGRTLILQPQSKRMELETWLCENGYGIFDARLCRDAGKLYTALFVKGGVKSTFCCAEELFLKNYDALLSAWLSQEAGKLEFALRGMEQAERDLSNACAKIQKQLEQIHIYQKEVAAW